MIGKKDVLRYVLLQRVPRGEDPPSLRRGLGRNTAKKQRDRTVETIHLYNYPSKASRLRAGRPMVAAGASKKRLIGKKDVLRYVLLQRMPREENLLPPSPRRGLRPEPG